MPHLFECDMCHKKNLKVKDSGFINEELGREAFKPDLQICSECVEWANSIRRHIDA